MKHAEENTAVLLEHAARQAGRTGRSVITRFFPASDCSLAVHMAREEQVEVEFDGGYPDAERVQACFHSTGEPPEFSGEWLLVTWNTRFAHVEHRDLLGSLLGLYGDRSWFGDLLIQEDRAYLRTLPEMARRLPGEWTQAGRAAIQAEAGELPETFLQAQGRELRITVASPRLDAVLSDVLRMSRSKGTEIIRSGTVQINHHTEIRPDQMLRAGDLLSIRGFGRARVCAIEETNRRGRIPVLLEIFF